MDFIADWNLYYRSDAEMIACTAGLDADSAWTELESTERGSTFERKGDDVAEQFATKY